jgi:phosphoesterase RecJ-like protein
MPRALREALTSCRRVLLTGPVDPDGDSLGACFALQALLEADGVDVVVTGHPSARYTFLPGVARLAPDDALDGAWDAVVVLDGDRHRLTPGVAAAFERARLRCIIDHHASTTADGYDIVWVDHTAPSTCEMIYRWLVEQGAPVTRDIATNLYAGIVFDTGGFRYSNTQPSTLRLAATLLEAGIDHHEVSLRILIERSRRGIAVAGSVFSGVTYALDGALAIGRVTQAMHVEIGIRSGDLEGIVDALVHTEGVLVGAVLNDAGGGRVKVSLRSRGAVDVAAVAQALSAKGGGHRKAAGALVMSPIEDVERRIVETVGPLLGR